MAQNVNAAGHDTGVGPAVSEALAAAKQAASLGDQAASLGNQAASLGNQAASLGVQATGVPSAPGPHAPSSAEARFDGQGSRKLPDHAVAQHSLVAEQAAHAGFGYLLNAPDLPAPDVHQQVGATQC